LKRCLFQRLNFGRTYTKQKRFLLVLIIGKTSYFIKTPFFFIHCHSSMHYTSAPASVQNSFEADSSLSPYLKKEPTSQLDIAADDTISTTKTNILVPPPGPVINFKTKTQTRLANWDFIAKGVLSPLPTNNLLSLIKKGTSELEGSSRANFKEISANLRGQPRGGTAPNISIILDPKNPKKVQLSSKVSFIDSHYVQSLDGNLDETNRKGNRANSLLMSSSYYGNTSSLQMDGMRQEDSRVSIIKDFLIRKSVHQPQNFAMKRKQQHLRDHSRPESSREMAKLVAKQQHNDNLDHLLNSSVSSIKSNQLDTYVDSIEDIETKESQESVRKKHGLDARENSPDQIKMDFRRKSMRRKSFVDDLTPLNKNVNEKSPMSNKDSDVSGSSESKLSAKYKRAAHHHHGMGSAKKILSSKVKLKHRIRRKSDTSTFSGGVCLKLEKHSDIILPADFKPKSAAAKILAQHAKAHKKTKVAKMLHSRVKIVQMFKRKGNEHSMSSPRLIQRGMSNTPNLEPNISHFGQSHHPSHFLVPPDHHNDSSSKQNSPHHHQHQHHQPKKEMSLRMIKVRSSGISPKKPFDVDTKSNLFTPVSLEKDSVGKSKFLSPVLGPQNNFNFSETDTRKSQQSSSTTGGFRELLKIDLKKKSKQQGELKDALKTVLTLNKKAENIFFKPKNVVKVKDLKGQSGQSQRMSRVASKEKLNHSSSTKYLSQKIELWPFMSPTDLNNAMEEKVFAAKKEEKVFGRREENEKSLMSPLQSPVQKRKYRKKKKLSLSITRSGSAPKISSSKNSPYAKPVYL